MSKKWLVPLQNLQKELLLADTVMRSILPADLLSWNTG